MVVAARRLIAAGRAGAAVDLLGGYRPEETDEDYANAVREELEPVVECQHPMSAQIATYEIQELFKWLQDRNFDWERVAHLEWQYLPLLSLDSNARTLERRLAEEPDFFA